MTPIQNYFKSFKALEAQSVRSLGVGVLCYIGLKTLQIEHQIAPHLSKAIMAVSAISILYFGGLLRENGFIRKYCGAGFCIPGLGTVKLSFSPNDIIYAQTNASLKFEKYSKIYAACVGWMRSREETLAEIKKSDWIDRIFKGED